MARGRSSAAIDGSTATLTRPRRRAAKIGDRADGRLEILDQPLGHREEVLAGAGQVDGARRAVEQAHPQGLLQPPDVQAEARLRQVQPFRRPGEIAEARHHDEDAHLLEVDIH